MVEHHLAKVGVASSNLVFRSNYAGVAELADAHDSKSCSFWSAGSTPATGIKVQKEPLRNQGFFLFLYTIEKFLYPLGMYPFIISILNLIDER